MSKTIQFTVTDAERAFFDEYAQRKGLSVSALAKMSLFAYEAAHHFKGIEMNNCPKNGRKPATDAVFARGSDFRGVSET